jgi:hypothetical protein
VLADLKSSWFYAEVELKKALGQTHEATGVFASGGQRHHHRMADAGEGSEREASDGGGAVSRH